MDRHPAGSNLDGETSRLFWAVAHKAARRAPYAGFDEAGLAEACRSLLRELLAASGRKRVIFSLDEAAPLCKKRAVVGGTVFQDFLDALLVFPSGVLGIVLDTSSRVHDFVPRGRALRQRGREGSHQSSFPSSSAFPLMGYWRCPRPSQARTLSQSHGTAAPFRGLCSDSFVAVFELRPSF